MTLIHSFPFLKKKNNKTGLYDEFIPRKGL